MSQKMRTRSNSLIHETSPYLLQHKNNPVHWFPWSNKAFEIAEEEGKPILLSIGYSTCHWCHVMNEECFEDEAVADYLNEHFIAVKVDREERPDVDAVYMRYCQLATGGGGWPLTVFMTPDQKPFYVGTYFNQPQFLQLLDSIHKLYKDDPDNVRQIGVKSALALEQMNTREIQQLNGGILNKAFDFFEQNFDEEYGGFSKAPKFPCPQQLMFLMRYYHKTENNYALHMVEKTIESMYQGGIFDHVGFGFSRYSTDARWLVPHFEKMLYDNALMLIVLTEAFQITGKDLYRELVDRVATYIMRDMTHDEGGFYSAEDADTEGGEGTYYLWSKQTILDILGPEDGPIYCNYYNITDEGNFEGSNIPNLVGTNLDELKEDKGLNSRLYEMNRMLLSRRVRRQRPHRDDKILVSWNGLMIVAMAKAGRVFGSQEFIDCGKRAFSFIENRLYNNGNLQASYRDEQAKNDAFLKDYAFLSWGLLELYESTHNHNYLSQCKEFVDQMIEKLWDDSVGGFYMYGQGHQQLISNIKEGTDGAMPSGNGVAGYVLVQLGRYLDEEYYEDKARALLGCFSQDLNSIPHGLTMMLMTYMYLGESIKRLILTGSSSDELAHSMRDIYYKAYHPFFISLHSDAKQEKHLPKYLAHYHDKDYKTRLYICTNQTCLQPIEALDELEKVLKTL